MPKALGPEVAITWRIAYFSAFGGLDCGLLLFMNPLIRSIGKGKIMVLVFSVAIVAKVCR